MHVCQNKLGPELQCQCQIKRLKTMHNLIYFLSLQSLIIPSPLCLWYLSTEYAADRWQWSKQKWMNLILTIGVWFQRLSRYAELLPVWKWYLCDKKHLYCIYVHRSTAAFPAASFRLTTIRLLCACVRVRVPPEIHWTPAVKQKIGTPHSVWLRRRGDMSHTAQWQTQSQKTKRNEDNRESMKPRMFKCLFSESF